MKTTVHLTTVHPRFDTRVLFREVWSLAQRPEWSVALIVADGQGSGTERVAGVDVAFRDMGLLPRSRLGRIAAGAVRSFREIRNVRPQLVHFHDPELIPVAIALKLIGCKVIYDVHEDVPRAIVDKFWIHPAIRNALAWIVDKVEMASAKLFDGIVCATPRIANRFPQHKTVVVQNFPIPSELSVETPTPYQQRDNSFAYVGALTATRGAREMILAIEQLGASISPRLELAGPIRPPLLESELRAMSGWTLVAYKDWVSRKQIAELLDRVRAGLVVLRPTPAYIHAYPIKMFEYMAAGLPVIASDFPLWRTIIEDAHCGLLVDPMDHDAIASAMKWIIENPHEAEAMGQRGRNAVERIYNWHNEERKLVSLYARLLPVTNSHEAGVT